MSVLGYPVETVLAEKTSTAIALGESNTRVRDYADLYTLTGKHMLLYTAMHTALEATTTYRQVALVPLSSVVGTLPALRQSAYQAFRTRLGKDGAHLPVDFSEVVSAVVAFVDPLTNAQAIDKIWVPNTRQWRD